MSHTWLRIKPWWISCFPPKGSMGRMVYLPIESTYLTLHVGKIPVPWTRHGCGYPRIPRIKRCRSFCDHFVKPRSAHIKQQHSLSNARRNLRNTELESPPQTPSGELDHSTSASAPAIQRAKPFLFALLVDPSKSFGTQNHKQHGPNQQWAARLRHSRNRSKRQPYWIVSGAVGSSHDRYQPHFLKFSCKAPIRQQGPASSLEDPHVHLWQFEENSRFRDSHCQVLNRNPRSNTFPSRSRMFHQIFAKRRKRPWHVFPKGLWRRSAGILLPHNRPKTTRNLVCSNSCIVLSHSDAGTRHSPLRLALFLYCVRLRRPSSKIYGGACITVSFEQQFAVPHINLYKNLYKEQHYL